MIEGVVNDAYEPILDLTVQGPSGQATEIEAIIDTGFNGFLTVTPALAAELGLPLEGTSRATLADSSEATFDVYDVMDELRRGVPKVIVFGNPSSSQQKAERKARHRAAAKRQSAKQPIR